jgi:hypothetical protein
MFNYKNKVPIKLGNLPIPYRLDRETRWKLCKMMRKVDKNVNFYSTRPLSHEIINFIDGKRRISDITDAVGYEYGIRIKAEHVLIFLLHLKEKGYLTFKK